MSRPENVLRVATVNVNGIRAAYRRGYHAAATRIAQAATELAEADLFDHLLAVGRERRSAAGRLAQLRALITSLN